jgi:hypothetical protein
MKKVKIHLKAIKWAYTYGIQGKIHITTLCALFFIVLCGLCLHSAGVTMHTAQC